MKKIVTLLEPVFIGAAMFAAAPFSYEGDASGFVDFIINECEFYFFEY